MIFDGMAMLVQRPAMLRTISIASLLLSFAFLAPRAEAAPKARPATFSGTYTASGHSGEDNSPGLSYDGDVTISRTGKVSGRIKSTEFRSLPDGTTEEIVERVAVTGRILRVKNTTHGGTKVLVAKTKIRVGGVGGTLTIYFPYLIPEAGISGGGVLKGSGGTGYMYFTKKATGAP